MFNSLIIQWMTFMEMSYEIYLYSYLQILAEIHASSRQKVLEGQLSLRSVVRVDACLEDLLLRDLLGGGLLGGRLGNLLGSGFLSCGLGSLLSCRFLGSLLGSGLLGSSLLGNGLLSSGLLGSLGLGLLLGKLEGSRGTSALDLLQGSSSNALLQGQTKAHSGFLLVSDLVVGDDVLQDGLAGRARALLQGLDSSGNHDGEGRVAGLGSGLLDSLLGRGGGSSS